MREFCEQGVEHEEAFLKYMYNVGIFNMVLKLLAIVCVTNLNNA